jgi:very-short-patch-repair endonuclease
MVMRPEIRRARELRRDMSEPEIILWSRLRRLRDRGFVIRRQFPFHGYFLDFACLARRLVVEVDGHQHGDEIAAEHDFVRDRILERAGFRVLRFWTSDVRSDLNWVMDQIVLALEQQPDIREGRQSAGAERVPDSLTLAASPPVPPRRGGEL